MTVPEPSNRADRTYRPLCARRPLISRSGANSRLLRRKPWIGKVVLVADPDDCPFCGANADDGPVPEVQTMQPLPDLAPFLQITLHRRR